MDGISQVLDKRYSLLLSEKKSGLTRNIAAHLLPSFLPECLQLQELQLTKDFLSCVVSLRILQDDRQSLSPSEVHSQVRGQTYKERAFLQVGLCSSEVDARFCGKPQRALGPEEAARRKPHLS